MPPSPLPPPPPLPPTRTQITAFFQNRHFALSGASAAREKFGYMLFAWYARHALPCVPINPRAAATTTTTNATTATALLPSGSGGNTSTSASHRPTTTTTSSSSSYLIDPRQTYPTVPTLSAMPGVFLASAGGYGGISLSIVTPPHVTLQTLREAHALGVKRVWMQPGAWDWECVLDGLVGASSGQWEAFIFGGEEEGEMVPGAQEGWCVLTHGEEGLRGARRNERGKRKGDRNGGDLGRGTKDEDVSKVK